MRCLGVGDADFGGSIGIDLAILFMSAHMCLQIFPPAHSFLGHDGLYRIRKFILASWFILPILDASLAFINSSGGYQAAGPFCTLPIRPYWYRLALSWTPRYIITIVILGVAIRIYRHVGKEFQVFGEERDQTSSRDLPIGQASTAPAAADAILSRRRKSLAASLRRHDTEKGPLDDDDLAPDETGGETGGPKRTRSQKHHSSPPESSMGSAGSPPSSRRPSAAQNHWSTAFAFPPTETLTTTGPSSVSIKSNPSSRRGSKQITVTGGIGAEDFAATPTPSGAGAGPFDMTRSGHRGSIATLNSIRSSAAPSTFEGATSLPPIREHNSTGSTGTAGAGSAQNAAAMIMRGRRRAIQRQLRLLFIYPIVYIMFWVLPFAYHAMNYSNYYAQNPVFVLSCFNTFCMSFLAVVDVSIFSWREKPWRHIPGSDGTFLGSFCFWRFCCGPEWQGSRRQSMAPSYLWDEGTESPEVAGGEGGSGDGEGKDSQTGLLGSIKRWSTGKNNLTVAPPGPPPGGPTESSVQSSAPQSPSRPVRPVMHRRVYSGGSDRKRMEADRAHERLALERADYELNRRSLNERRGSMWSAGIVAVPPLGHASAPGSPTASRFGSGGGEGPDRGSKDWWDRQVDAELFADDDEEEKDDEGKVGGEGSPSPATTGSPIKENP
jgi:G protein-coupled receptor GPR1